MSRKSSMYFIFSQLWKNISRVRRLQLIFLIPLMFLAGLMEAVNIGLLMPFIAALSKPSLAYEVSLQKFPVIGNLGLSSPGEYLYLMGSILILVTILSALVRSFMVFCQTKISYGIGADLSIKIFSRTLYQPYLTHTSRNSSEVISVITNKASLVVVNVIYPAINILSAIFIAAVVIFTLVYINPASASLALAGFGLLYMFVILLSRKKIFSDSEKINREMNKVVQLVQEGLGGIRDILIDRTQIVYINSFSGAERNLRNSLANIQLISTIPRLIIESSAIILIVILALVISAQISDITSALPFIGVIALGGQRLLPLLNQIYVGWASIAGSQSNSEEVIRFLGQPMPKEVNCDLKTATLFDHTLELKNVSYSYTYPINYALCDVNLKIKKGEIIGIIGKSGAGKSTLLDLILGLIDPIEGEIHVDGKSILEFREKLYWQQKIAHVPQNIYLSDATFAENIAFGVPIDQIDFDKVIYAARLAHISDFIEAKPKSYLASVGERGAQLSGGQRQRIGIARAFYKTSEVIIFDEATSALDEITENQIFDSIKSLPMSATVLIVSHRPQTLKNCSKIIELSRGKLMRIDSYSNFFKND